ncbi:MAG: RNase adapter RapZ [Nannocystaceae bacterium]
MHLLVVTGMSGAGKSTALRALEDLGYYCVDNLPVQLLGDLIDRIDQHSSDRKVAVGIGAQLPSQAQAFPEVRRRLVAAGHVVKLLFFEASVDAIIRRYAETRRLHPMGALPEAIERERGLLDKLRNEAFSVLDTTPLGSRELRRVVRERFAESGVMHLALVSFGFKNGLPREADLVFDARFLGNPFDDLQLRPLSGLDAPVAQFVLQQNDACEVLSHVASWLRFQVPRALREGRSYLTAAIGCTGGQHRSVALVAALHAELGAGAPLADQPLTLSVRHRDLQERARE